MIEKLMPGCYISVFGSYRYPLTFCRNFATFHEEAVNRILDDIVRACNPRKALVAGEFRPRGGISINIEASYSEEE